MMNIVLEKYHGLGNDYFVFDPNKNELKLTKENVRMICDRNFGMGSDGILEGPIFQEDRIYGIRMEVKRRKVGMEIVFLQNI